MYFTEETLLGLLLILILETQSADSQQPQILETRELYPFHAYKDVQIFHYSIPPLVSKATFQYQANGSSHCSSKEISVYLQYGSYPVMNPDNASFPESFIVRRQFLHNITLHTDSVPVILNISSPLPGNWYAAAYLVESSERIAQKGLFTPCSGWLTSSVKYSVSNNVITILSEFELSQELLGMQMYRFFAPYNSWVSRVMLRKCTHGLHSSCPVMMTARPLAYPLPEKEIDSTTVNCTSFSECFLEFIPIANDWNYVMVKSLDLEIVKFDIVLETEGCHSQDLRDYSDIQTMIDSVALELSNISGSKANLHFYSENLTCWPEIPLTRISYPTSLAFEYNMPPVVDDMYPLIKNISNDNPTFMKFEVLPSIDIGGTLVIELAVSPFMNYTMSNISVTGCLKYQVRPNSSRENYCDSGIVLHVNTSIWISRFTTVLVPFPESGLWYLSLLPNCHIPDSNKNGSHVMTSVCEYDYTSVFLRIRSAPCILGQCGSYGTCYQYVSGGFIFSTCSCIAGWKGWGCTDQSSAKSDAQLLISVLLLTLSNILFIPVVVIAVYRKYYTEAFIYSSTMFFSTFYHACDAEVYSFCLMRLSVLQFCDFYSAILSVWVTLIAMAELPNAAQSFVHMAGAVGVALGVEYDRTGLWVFVLPTGIGLSIMLTSWIMQCRKKHACHPEQRTWIFYLLPGSFLAAFGLIMYAFFETKDNYAFVHSAWHGTIALSVLFLLPKRQKKSKYTPQPIGASSYAYVGDQESNAPLPNNTLYEHLLNVTP